MKVTLVFHDWFKLGCPDSIYNTEEGINLSASELHSGSTFEVELEFNNTYYERIISDALEAGFVPVFKVMQEN